MYRAHARPLFYYGRRYEPHPSLPSPKGAHPCYRYASAPFGPGASTKARTGALATKEGRA